MLPKISLKVPKKFSASWNIRPEYCFLVIALIVGSCFAILIPAGAGADEPNHIARVQDLAHGNIFADPIPDRVGYTSPLDTEKVDATLYGGVVDDALMDVAWNNMYKFHAGKEESGQSLYAFPTWETEGVVADLDIGEGEHVEAYSNAAVNSPVVYLPYVVGYWIGHLFTDNAYAVILVMRIFGLLTSIAVLFYCIRVIPVGKWILATVALIPNMIIFNASVTADTVTFAVCMLFLTQLLRMCVLNGTPTKMQWVLLIIATVLLALVKLSYLPFAALLLLIPLFNESMRTKKMVLSVGAIGVGTGIIFLLWYFAVSGINTGAMFNVGASPTLQKDVIFSDPIGYTKVLIKQFFAQNYFNIDVYGTLDAHGHMEYAGWGTILALCCSICFVDNREYGLEYLQKHSRLFSYACYSVCVCIFLLVSTALYLQFTSVGARTIAGIQSRYFLPILPIALMPIFVAYNRGRSSDPIAGKTSISSGLMLAVQCVSAIGAMFILYTTLYTA